MAGDEIQDGLRYTNDHEWVRVVGDQGNVQVGITDFAQDALGDVVYVSLPAVGARHASRIASRLIPT